MSPCLSRCPRCSSLLARPRPALSVFSLLTSRRPRPAQARPLSVGTVVKLSDRTWTISQAASGNSCSSSGLDRTGRAGQGKVGRRCLLYPPLQSGVRGEKQVCVSPPLTAHHRTQPWGGNTSHHQPIQREWKCAPHSPHTFHKNLSVNRKILVRKTSGKMNTIMFRFVDHLRHLAGVSQVF